MPEPECSMPARPHPRLAQALMPGPPLRAPQGALLPPARTSLARQACRRPRPRGCAELALWRWPRWLAPVAL
eukprot:10231809-Alexandrium_andersonii.AAC.1